MSKITKTHAGEREGDDRFERTCALYFRHTVLAKMGLHWPKDMPHPVENLHMNAAGLYESKPLDPKNEPDRRAMDSVRANVRRVLAAYESARFPLEETPHG